MRKIDFLRVIAVFLFGLAAAPAAATTYHCMLTPKGSHDLIPPELYLTYDESSGAVTVFDGFIKAQVGEPIEGTLRSANSTRLLFGWTVPGVRNESGQYTAGITFTLNIIRATGAAQMTSYPQGYVNKWRGSGTCTKE